MCKSSMNKKIKTIRPTLDQTSHEPCLRPVKPGFYGCAARSVTECLALVAILEAKQLGIVFSEINIEFTWFGVGKRTLRRGMTGGVV